MMVNVEVGNREALDGAGAVWEAVKEEEAPLEGRGRILLRPSGTEPLVRVMVEAPDAAEADAICERLGGSRQARARPSLSARASTLNRLQCAESSDTWGAAPAGNFSSPDSRSSSTGAMTLPASR